MGIESRQTMLPGWTKWRFLKPAVLGGIRDAHPESDELCSACYRAMAVGVEGNTLYYPTNEVAGAAPCRVGNASLKYALKTEVMENHLSNTRMQLGSANPTVNVAARDRWDYQTPGECYANVAVGAWNTHRCVKNDNEDGFEECDGYEACQYTPITCYGASAPPRPPFSPSPPLPPPPRPPPVVCPALAGVQGDGHTIDITGLTVNCLKTVGITKSVCSAAYFVNATHVSTCGVVSLAGEWECLVQETHACWSPPLPPPLSPPLSPPPSPPPSPPAAPSSALNVGLIVGILCATSAVLVIVGVVLYCLVFRSPKRGKGGETERLT